MKDVVVTAYGLVSPLGHNVDIFKKRMFAGESGVKSIRGTLVPESFPVPYAAVIDRESLPETKFYSGVNTQEHLKSWLMTAAATEQALESLDPKHKIDAVFYGTADGVSFDYVVKMLKTKVKESFEYLKTTSESSLDILRDVVSSRGFSPISDENLISINSACASGNQALGLAFQALQQGRYQRVLVGGVDARCEPSNFLNFHFLGALTSADVPPHKASRPFSGDRSGFVRGEGAAVLVLETREAALERNAPILGNILGYGCTSDAYRLTDGREDGMSVVEAMQQALRSAGLQPTDIDYINAHGTSTPLNDRLETAAIKKVFAEYAYKIPVSSLKSQIGHSTIASSAIEAVACLIMLQEQKISPTLNLDVPDPLCDLDYVPHKSREAKLLKVLSNSFGFGGQNSCLVLGRES
ncbi:MAG: beta-ketoacyl-[acyl-carrier-protein] synthase family protein [Pseudobdellovibrionaceae bacterium]